MNETLGLSFFLDGLIIILLVTTIIYAARLSLYLKRFRDSKADLEAIVTDLSKQVTKADVAIKNLHEAADESGKDLQHRTNKANAMFDELQLMVEAGDALAARLEKLATKNRQILDGTEGTPSITPAQKGNYEQRVKKLVKTIDANPAVDDNKPLSSMFSIRDNDIERGEKPDGFGYNPDDNEVLSDAERDLYQALKTKKTRQTGGGKL